MTSRGVARAACWLVVLWGLLAPSHAQGPHRSLLTPGYYRAQALLDNGHADGAALLFDSLYRAKPREWYLLASARAYLSAGQPDSARHRLSGKALGKSLEAELLRAQTECYFGDPGRGIALLRRYLGARKKLPELSLQNDTLLRPCHAHRAWDSIWIGTRFTRDQRWLGDLEYHARQGDWEIMEDILDGFPPRQQERAQYAYYRALSLLGLSDTVSALNAAKAAYKRYAKRGKYVLLYARLLRLCGQGEKALRVLRRYAPRDPHNPALLAASAEAEYTVGEYGAAYGHARAYLEYYPSDTAVLQLYVRAAYREARYASSLRAISRLLPLVPASQSVSLYYLRGMVMLQLGEPRQSLPDFDSALQVSPMDTTILMQRGKVLLRLQQPDTACEDFVRAYNAGCRPALVWKGRACR